MKNLYTTLFIDIGGVLLTNGWDHQSREKAAKKFDIDLAEFNERHGLSFDTFENGRLTLNEYLFDAVFYKPRSFSLEEFKQFMFSQSQPFNEMIELIRTLKAKYRFKTVTVSNEGRELAEYRIKTFKLNDLFDIAIYSGFVHLRKPDREIYRMALDLAQASPEEVIYIDDRPLLAEIGSQLGFHAIQHVDVQTTKKALEGIL